MSGPPPAYESDIQVVRATTPQPPQQWSLALNVTRSLPGDDLVNHPRNVNPYAVSREETPAFNTDILWDPNSVTSRVGSGYAVNGPGLYAAVGYGLEDVVDYDADSKHRNPSISSFFLLLLLLVRIQYSHCDT